MASPLCRVGYNVLKRAFLPLARPLSTTACRRDNELGHWSKKEKKIPDTISVDDSIKIVEGAEKFDLIGSAAGIDDPFEPAMMEQALELGTFACPNLVPSTDEWRIVGCLCDEDAVEIKYTILNKGEKKQCDCGKWFQLVPVELQDM
ncbi:cytochrome c oxidase subunit 5B, mitochondrial-like [Mytilus galloprovincialis]|uniref:Cytochrome c oxidase subunit 5b n=1 Tax=Mytilus galloprovincialis TaxID=29158 RepID=A0A8B6G281_MYTGA|nr:cytochrome c oxidase subunit 5b [Mytilus galloprovincialis]